MVIEQLSGWAGAWQGKNLLFFSADSPGIESEITATLAPILGGRFLRFDYTWSYENEPKEGSILVAFDKESGKTSAYWIDSFHMGSSVMTLTGDGSAGKFSVDGSYPAPTGPDWGWRIALEPEGETLHLKMWNIEPGDAPQIAVQADLTRA